MSSVTTCIDGHVRGYVNGNVRPFCTFEDKNVIQTFQNSKIQTFKTEWRNFNAGKNSLAHVKNQFNLRILYVMLVENISTYVNRVWETNGFTPILFKSLLISKIVRYFDNLAKCFSNIFNYRNIYFKPIQVYTDFRFKT